MKQDPRHRDNRLHLMKIGQLSSASGVSRSSIHHYLNIGLLGAPVRAGLNLHLYDGSHLERLMEIKTLRETEKLPLKTIKAMLEARGRDLPPGSRRESQPDPPGTPGPVPTAATGTGPGTKRQRIVEVATEMFGLRGYEAVRISDIAAALHMGKATFYEYFQNKEELFVECIEGLSLAVVPREKWKEIDRETDFFCRFELRARAFLEAFESYWGILNLAQTISSKKGSDLAEKGMAAIRLMTLPVCREIKDAQAAGTVRDTDPEFTSYLLLGLAEWVGYRLTMDKKYTAEEALDLFMDFVRKALALNPGE